MTTSTSTNSNCSLALFMVEASVCTVNNAATPMYRSLSDIVVEVWVKGMHIVILSECLL